MAQQEDFRGLNKIALKLLGVSGINAAVSPDLLSGIVQYWTAQSNVSVVFATVFATIGTTFLTQFDGYDRWISIFPFITFFYFMIRTWAFGRCAKIAVSLWL